MHLFLVSIIWLRECSRVWRVLDVVLPEIDREFFCCGYSLGAVFFDVPLDVLHKKSGAIDSTGI